MKLWIRVKCCIFLLFPLHFLQQLTPSKGTWCKTYAPFENLWQIINPLKLCGRLHTERFTLFTVNLYKKKDLPTFNIQLLLQKSHNCTWQTTNTFTSAYANLQNLYKIFTRKNRSSKKFYFEAPFHFQLEVHNSHLHKSLNYLLQLWLKKSKRR